MSASNGQLLASATSGAPLYRASDGALLYDVNAVPVTTTFILGEKSYELGSSGYADISSYVDPDYWDAHKQEMMDALDAANRPAFLADPFGYNRPHHVSVDYHNRSIYYYAFCVRLRVDYRTIVPFSSAASASIRISCGRTFTGADSDTFDDRSYVVGAFSDNSSAFSSPADVIAASHFRINIGDCHRVTKTLTPLGRIYFSQSGHSSTNTYTPSQDVQIDSALPYIRALSDAVNIYLFLAIDSPCHIPYADDYYTWYGIGCSVDSLSITA